MNGSDRCRSFTNPFGLIVDIEVHVVVDGRLVVELKTVERLIPVHQAQLLTYLRLGGWKTGLLMNFHSPALKDGVKRMVL